MNDIEKMRHLIRDVVGSPNLFMKSYCDNFRNITAKFEQARVIEAMVLCRGRQTKAAKLCNLNRNTLRKRLRDAGLTYKDFTGA